MFLDTLILDFFLLDNEKIARNTNSGTIFLYFCSMSSSPTVLEPQHTSRNIHEFDLRHCFQSEVKHVFWMLLYC